MRKFYYIWVVLTLLVGWVIIDGFFFELIDKVDVFVWRFKINMGTIMRINIFSFLVIPIFNWMKEKSEV